MCGNFWARTSLNDLSLLSAWCLGGHVFDSCGEFRYFLCLTSGVILINLSFRFLSCFQTANPCWLNLYVLITLFSYFFKYSLLPVAVLSFRAKPYFLSKLRWLLALLILSNQNKLLLIFNETVLGAILKILTQLLPLMANPSFYCIFLVKQKRRLGLSSTGPKDLSRARECVIAKHVSLSNRFRRFTHVPFCDLPTYRHTVRPETQKDVPRSRTDFCLEIPACGCKICVHWWWFCVF